MHDVFEYMYVCIYYIYIIYIINIMKTSDVKASKCQLQFSPRIIGEIIKILKIKINFLTKK